MIKVLFLLCILFSPLLSFNISNINDIKKISMIRTASKGLLLHSIITNSYNDIQNFYFFPSKRWDIELKNNIIIKLPITNNNRQCDSEYGCDELYDEDEVSIPAYNGSFKVKIYDYFTFKGSPYSQVILSPLSRVVIYSMTD